MPVFLRIAGGPLAGYIAIAVPWVAALIVALYRRHVRIIGFVAALLSTVACALPLGVEKPRVRIGVQPVVNVQCHDRQAFTRRGVQRGMQQGG